jgi:hypothetical protein
MKLNRIALLAGWLVVGAGFFSTVTADCAPPSREEIEAQRDAFFTEADADGDKALSQEEFTLFTQLLEAARADHFFSCLDSDGDGLVSSAELSAHRPPWGPGPGRPF